MNIVYLTAGAAGMYCGSCLHDNTLASALIEAGEQVLLVPAYTPIRTDEEDVSSRHLVFGGINVWLQQRSRLFQFTPAWVDRLLDSPRLVGWLSRAAGVTRPESLGPMTLSMLQGLDGRQQKEFRKLVSWLAEEIRPDIVHLSNTLLVGVVQPLKQVLGVPIVCSLSGEDAFLERLPSVWRIQALERLREACRELDRLIALNDDYAHFMSQYLDYPRERILTVPHGLNLRGYGPRERPAGSGGIIHHRLSGEDLCRKGAARPGGGLCDPLAKARSAAAETRRGGLSRPAGTVLPGRGSEFLDPQRAR